MEKKEVTIDNPIALDGVTLIPVAKVSLNYGHSNGSILLFGVKQAIAVIVISASEKKAFRITGEEVSIDELAQEFPSVKGILEGI